MTQTDADAKQRLALLTRECNRESEIGSNGAFYHTDDSPCDESCRTPLIELLDKNGKSATALAGKWRNRRSPPSWIKRCNRRVLESRASLDF